MSIVAPKPRLMVNRVVRASVNYPICKCNAPSPAPTPPPPPAPFTRSVHEVLSISDQYVVLPPNPVVWLTHFDEESGAWIEQTGRTVTTHGTVIRYVPPIAVPPHPAFKFGPGAAGFSGISSDGGYLTAPNTERFLMGSQPWVWDWWFNGAPSTAHPNMLFSATKATGDLWSSFAVDGSGDGSVWGFEFLASSDQAGDNFDVQVIQAIAPDPSGAFHHGRCGRIDDTRFGISLDGNTPTIVTIPPGRTFNPEPTGTFYVGWSVGEFSSGDNPWAGPIDELCCRRNVAMNDTAFTPPEVPFIYP